MFIHVHGVHCFHGFHMFSRQCFMRKVEWGWASICYVFHCRNSPPGRLKPARKKPARHEMTHFTPGSGKLGRRFARQEKRTSTESTGVEFPKNCCTKIESLNTQSSITFTLTALQHVSTLFTLGTATLGHLKNSN